jgi:hypothetical protein
MPAVFIFSDIEFIDAQWELITVIAGTASGSASQDEAAGNPGACRVMTNLLAASPSRVDGYHLCPSAIYSPAEHGVIHSINASIDACLVSSTNPTQMHDGMGFGFALRQNGKLYRAGYSVTTHVIAWNTHTVNGLTAADFTTLAGPNDHPDFSAGGSPVTFGFRTANSTSPGGNQSYKMVVKFDNWSIQVIRLSA